MTLEQQVVSLDLAKRLKELGVKQDSLFYWRLNYHTSGTPDGKKEGHFGEGYDLQYYPKPRYSTADVKWNQSDLSKLDETEVSAFTVAEVGLLTPSAIHVESVWKQMFIDRFHDKWLTGYSDIYDDDKPFMDTEADSKGELLVWLIKNGLIKL